MPESVRAVVADGDRAWPAFLREFSPFILSCIGRFASDRDERMEIYVHVCRRLVAEDCRRIRQYRGVGRLGACKFSTWLAAVVFNLAREWIRSVRGRKRLFRSLADLDRIDRLIFRFYFWDGFSIAQIATLLRTKEHVKVHRTDVLQRLESIERRLSKDHRWRLVTSLLRSAGPLSLSGPRTMVHEDIPFELPDVRAGQDVSLESGRAQQVLRTLIKKLPDEERLAIRLRFDRGLTAREVAKVLGLANYKRVYEIQGRALARLADGLREAGLELQDFAPFSAMDVLR